MLLQNKTWRHARALSHYCLIKYCSRLSQEKDAHAATQAQFRSLYRDKYTPLKAWRADHEGEVRTHYTLHTDPTSSLACLHNPSTQRLPGTRQSRT